MAGGWQSAYRMRAVKNTSTFSFSVSDSFSSLSLHLRFVGDALESNTILTFFSLGGRSKTKMPQDSYSLLCIKNLFDIIKMQKNVLLLLVTPRKQIINHEIWRHVLLNS